MPAYELKLIDETTEFSENAGIADALETIRQNLTTSMQLSPLRCKEMCGEAIQIFTEIYKLVEDEYQNGTSLYYRKGLYRYREEKNTLEPPHNILSMINDEFINFIHNYRSNYVYSEIERTLTFFSIIDKKVDEDEDEYIW